MFFTAHVTKIGWKVCYSKKTQNETKNPHKHIKSSQLQINT